MIVDKEIVVDAIMVDISADDSIVEEDIVVDKVVVEAMVVVCNGRFYDIYNWIISPKFTNL